MFYKIQNGLVAIPMPLLPKLHHLRTQTGTYKMRNRESNLINDYKMRKYTRSYFRSLFTFTAVSATRDCRLQTDERSYDARPSAEL